MSLLVSAHLRAEGARLLVSYEAKNDGERALWLLDDLVARAAEQGFRRTPKTLLVQEDEDPRLVRLVRGFLYPEADVAFLLMPGARRLDPGQTLTGEAEGPLPLLANHLQGKPRRLRGDRTHAVLELGEIEALGEGDPPLRASPTTDGVEVLMPDAAYVLRHQKLVRSAEMALPAP